MIDINSNSLIILILFIVLFNKKIEKFPVKIKQCPCGDPCLPEKGKTCYVYNMREFGEFCKGKLDNKSKCPYDLELERKKKELEEAKKKENELKLKKELMEKLKKELMEKLNKECDKAKGELNSLIESKNKQIDDINVKLDSSIVDLDLKNEELKKLKSDNDNDIKNLENKISNLNDNISNLESQINNYIEEDVKQDNKINYLLKKINKNFYIYMLLIIIYFYRKKKSKNI